MRTSLTTARKLLTGLMPKSSCPTTVTTNASTVKIVRGTRQNRDDQDERLYRQACRVGMLGWGECNVRFGGNAAAAYPCLELRCVSGGTGTRGGACSNDAYCYSQ